MANATRSICPFCSMGCTLRIHPGTTAPYIGEAGIASLDYDPDGRFNRGSLCGKGNMALELLTHPRRIESPRLRANGHHEEATWDDALRHVAGRLGVVLRDVGPRGVGLLLGPWLTNEEARSAAALARALGIPNVDGGLPEDRALLAGAQRSCARPALVQAVEEIDALTAVLAVGDVFTVAPCLARSVLHARYDRRKNRLGTLAGVRSRTTWFGKPDLRCGPAREVPALAVMLHVALARDAARALPWAERAREVLERVGLEALEGLAGLPRAAVVDLVDTLAAEEHSGVLVGACFGETERPDLAAGLAALLAEATGSRLLVLPQGPNARGVREVLAQAGYPERTGLAAPEMLEAAVTGDLKALLVLGMDPLAALPGALPLHAARALDLLVVTAPMPGLTTEPAHVVLPSLAWGEKEGTVTNAFGTSEALAVALPPPGAARSDLAILAALHAALGAPVARPVPPPPAATSCAETPFFGDLDLHLRLERREWGGYEIGSHLVLAQGSPSQAADGWLTRDLSWPRHEASGPDVVLSQADAARLGVQAGQAVRLRSPVGETVLVARLEPRLPDAVVLVPPHEPSIRRLMRWRVDPALRDLDLRPCRVSVEPAQENGDE